MNITIWNIIVVIGVVGIALQLVPGLIWAERKVCARIQGRLGPNRVGPFGLLQPVADAIKLLTKEEIVPAGVDKPLYYLGPFMVFVPAAMAMAVVPWGHDMVIAGQRVALQVAELHVGILFVLAFTSLGVYGIAFGGWASNSKFPLLAALRSSAQMISYEVPMGLAVVAVVMSAGSVDLREIVMAQQSTWLGVVPQWFIFKQPLAALLFLIAAFAENNRLPFDLPEAESELVGGYHTEYSGMKFAMFFLGEYVAMITMSAVFTALFLGGWGLPGVIDPNSVTVGNALLSFLVFMTKVAAMLFFYLWVRWTLPRFRYDQLMKLGWKVLIPLALFNVLLTGVAGIL